MGKIFCILGKSGCGKDTVYRALLQDRDLKLKGVVTYTTRPRRDDEIDGVEYHFVSLETLKTYKAEGKMIELRQYDTVHGPWYYCTVDDGSIDLSSGNYLVISTLDALEGLSRYFGKDNVVPFYIYIDDGLRLQRKLERESREKVPDYNELCRRFLADGQDFSGKRLKSYGITEAYRNVELLKCVGSIKMSIRRHLGL